MPTWLCWQTLYDVMAIWVGVSGCSAMRTAEPARVGRILVHIQLFGLYI